MIVVTAMPGNTRKALAILAAVVLPASLGLTPIEFTSVAEALLVVLPGC